jgi:hypothetical protein
MRRRRCFTKKDDKIAVITQDKIQGKETGNDTGHVVTPVFFRPAQSLHRRIIWAEAGVAWWRDDRHGFISFKNKMTENCQDKSLDSQDLRFIV